MTQATVAPADAIAYSLPRAAQLLGCSRRVLDHALEQGTLRGYLVGPNLGKTIVKRDDLIAWIEAQPQSGDAA